MFNEWENEKCMKRGIDYTMLKEAGQTNVRRRII